MANGDQSPIALFDRAVLLQLSTGRFCATKKVANLAEVAVDADKDRLHLSADLLASPELDRIYSFDGATRREIQSRALPVSLVAPGVYVLGIPIIEEIDRYLERREIQRRDLVAEFGGVYELRAESGRRALGVLADPAKYPPVSVVLRAFSLSWSWFTLGAPATLETLRPEIFERERAKFETQFSEALDEAREALRVMAAGMVDHLLDRLSPDVSGKKKRFEKTTVEKLITWCDNFDARNLADDADLAAQVARIRGILGSVDAQSLRASSFLRRDVSGRLVEVKGALDALLVEPSRRAFGRASVVDAAPAEPADPADVEPIQPSIVWGRVA